MKDLNKIAWNGLVNHSDNGPRRQIFQPIGCYDPHRSRIIFGEDSENHNLRPSGLRWSKPD